MKKVANFLDLHIVDYCQLNCRHCYLSQGNSFMPIDLLKNVCIDFLQTNFPLTESTIILSGGNLFSIPTLMITRTSISSQ